MQVLTFCPCKAEEGISTKTFIGYLLKTKEFVNYADKNASGANLPELSPKMIKRFEAVRPPLDLQKQFDEFVGRVNSEKQRTVNSSKKSEALFLSLVQEAFG
ncbi:MAG: hypothetical protein U5K72_02890 [Balneolaceae bacterium]|nr:hypothetical protein [Balneolaceae bacterium]